MSRKNFIDELIEYIDDPDCEVSWTSNGKQIKFLRDRTEMNKYFLKKGNKYSASIKRQLIWYGFKCVKYTKEYSYYYHKHFMRDHPELYKTITRKQKNIKQCSNCKNLMIEMDRVNRHNDKLKLMVSSDSTIEDNGVKTIPEETELQEKTEDKIRELKYDKEKMIQIIMDIEEEKMKLKIEIEEFRVKFNKMHEEKMENFFVI